ncbi:MAG: glycogen synthase [Actinomycetia bacterium]|nr:glycogen synthase [Actinomycetes bacterium]
MRIDVLTKEYPPAIYGGAGVHAAELVRALRELGSDGSIEVQVRAFGDERDEADTTSYADLEELAEANGALQTMGVDLLMANDAVGADIVHSHTWYANFAGHTASLLGDIPHVITAHSLEPLRPWKAEQLGGGYRVSSWVEKTAYEAAAGVIAVSDGMRKDILRSYPDIDESKVHVVHNGIDSELWARNEDAEILRKHGVDPDRKAVIFVGRITRQKGLPYFLRAARALPPDVQLILCAGAPDTPAIKAEVEGLIDELKTERDGVIWIADMLPRAEVVALLSGSTVFVCPSVYEPLGIVNLEAMACEVAVVATATGGIPEVVVDGETGWLVPIEQVQDGTGTPVDPDTFIKDLGDALVEAVSDEERALAYGRAGRERAVEQFSWATIAERTKEVYERVLRDWADR